MKIETSILNEIQARVEAGSYFTKEELYRLKENLFFLFSIPSCNVTDKIVEDIERAFHKMYFSSKINGASISLSTSFHAISMYLGKSVHNECITEKTVFDIASITKLFTTLLTFQLSENHILSLDEKVSDILPIYRLPNYTIFDLLKMSGEIRTIQRVDEAKTKEEAVEYLQTSYLYNGDKEVSKYSDIGMMILPFLICKKVKEKIGQNMSYEEIIDTFLFQPCKFLYTGYLKDKYVAGNGREDNLVHDPKARKIGGVTGSAGLFSNGHDFALLGKKLFYENILSFKHLKLLYTNYYGKERGIGGIYQKHPNFRMTYVPRFYSEKSFASEGFTGSVVTFDLQNKIQNSFLIDAIVLGESRKRKDFGDYFREFQKEVSYQTFLLDCFDKIQYKVKHL